MCHGPYTKAIDNYLDSVIMVFMRIAPTRKRREEGRCYSAEPSQITQMKGERE
jgi:hypothetical protein